MQTKKIKNQKPISLDVYFRYKCPSNSCENEHWLSLLETQTKNFKIVCECGIVFKPKKIEKLDIVYAKTKIESTTKINDALVRKAVPSLVDLGFSNKEAYELLLEAYNKCPTDNLSLLIKNTLFGVRNNG